MNYENYDPSFPDQPVVDLYLPIWASLPAFRSKPAFIWSDHGSTNSVLTYSQLNDSVELISAQLLNSVSQRENVLVLCQPGLELVEVIFGCQRAGLLSIPVFPPSPCFSNQNYHHLVRVFSQTKPKAAIADKEYIAKVRSYMSSSNANGRLVELLRQVKWISTNELKNKRGVIVKSTSNTYNGCLPDDVYLIQYTSGATGIPKPVMVTAGSAVHNVRAARKAYDLHPNSVIASWLPQYHDCGLQFLLLSIISGATSVLTSPLSFLRRPRLWLDLISAFSATCTPVPSFTLPLVLRRGKIDSRSPILNLSSLKNLIIINEPIFKASVDEFVAVFEEFGLDPASISPSYGLAENCTFVSTAWRSGSGGGVDLPVYKKLLPISRLDGEDEDMEVVVVNEETNESVSDGIEGEIWVSSPSNCAGYLDHPNLTREIFQARMKNTVSRWFVRTGDRGIIKGEERFLYVIGRCADVIKLESGGEIHPHYIESAAQNSCRRFIRGGCLAAFEVRNSIALVAEMQGRVENGVVLRGICEEIRKGVMEEEGVEIGLVVLVESGDLPKTTSGKIQRWAAKMKLVEGKMNVVMEFALGKNNNGEDVGKNKSKVDEKEKRWVSKIANSPNLISHL